MTASASSNLVPSLGELRQSTAAKFSIGCDTEFQGATTLSAQFAIRIGQTIFVQLYRSPRVPEPSQDFNLQPLQHMVRNWCDQLVLRPIGVLTRQLSPVRVLRDLLAIPKVQAVSRLKGDLLRQDREKGEPITLSMIAHFWPADFFRIFGRSFFTRLALACRERETGLCIQSNKLLAFREVGKYRHSDPVLEYASEDDVVYPIRVKMFDTALPFGKGSLDAHAASFLGVPKLDTISKEEKAMMRAVFRDRTDEAFLYASLDAILALLVEEQMKVADQRMYRTLGFVDDSIPPLRPTQGSRVAETLVKCIAKDVAAGSVLLSKKGKRLKDGSIGKVSQRKIEALFSQGSGERIATEHRSRFGAQTGETHGGLLFTRSPDQFFHAADRQFRDVDLSGCYGSILSSLNLYIGRPCIHEPGSKQLTLQEAVSLMNKHAAGNDAWIVKVSGRITRFPNVLIPSTRQALTNANYKNRVARRNATQSRHGFTFDWMQEASSCATGTSAIFTDVIEAGIVAWSTWLMIETLPEAWRQEYEQLEVESLVFYPKRLVADSGPEYDRLTEAYGNQESAWSARLDMEGLSQTTVEKLDEQYVSLCYPIGQLAATLAAKREEAKKEFGKGSAAEQGLKQHVNTMYGVAASRYLSTNNVVLANIITATARALAFAMQLSLNGFQVITDGCIYRRDQIPCTTLTDCLSTAEDYPIHRAEQGIPFHDPAAIPDDDAAFTTWYQNHVKHFFGACGPDYDTLFSLHRLEHKQCGKPEQAAFDGLCCDGSANYLKLLRTDEGWQAIDFKARSYDADSKEMLEPWIVQTYASDQYQGPPPFSQTLSIVKYKEAVALSGRALKYLTKKFGVPPAGVVMPLGWQRYKVMAYKVIKDSAFLFRTPEQRERVVKGIKKFVDSCGCGLEVLALRQSRQDRQQGSLRDVARTLYEFIRSGGDNIVKHLNLNRPFEGLDQVRKTHFKEMQVRKRRLLHRFYETLDVRQQKGSALITGMIVQAEDGILIERPSADD